MQIETTNALSTELCRANPNKVYVFGDNLIGKGTGGQACIRYEANSFGIPTKRLPSMRCDAFFSDKEDERLALENSLRQLWKVGQHKVLVFPEDGLGTGRAMMSEKSPFLYKLMCDILLKHFGFDNGVNQC